MYNDYKIVSTLQLELMGLYRKIYTLSVIVKFAVNQRARALKGNICRTGNANASQFRENVSLVEEQNTGPKVRLGNGKLPCGIVLFGFINGA